MPSLPKHVTTGAFVQCQLKLLIELEVIHGWPLDGVRGENLNFFRTKLSELLDTPLTEALEEVMIELCVDQDFLDAFDEALEDLPHLEPEHGGRLALAQAMGQRWQYIRREVEGRSNATHLRLPD